MKFIKTKTFGAKLLSGLLSVAMILSSMPTQVYAADADIPAAEERTLTEDELAQLIASNIVIDEPVDDNVNSIPENEDGDDQTILDVDTPPNIENVSDPEDETSQSSGIEITIDDPSIDVTDNEGNQDDGESSNEPGTDSTDSTDVEQSTGTDENSESTDTADTVDDTDTDSSTEDSTDNVDGTEDSTTDDSDSTDTTDNINSTEDGTTDDSESSDTPENIEGSDSTDTTEDSTDIGKDTDTEDSTVTDTEDGTDSTITDTEDSTDTEEGTTDEETSVDETSEDGESTDTVETIAPTYNYNVTLNETNINVTKGTEYNINATVVVTLDPEDDSEDPIVVEDAQYSFKYTVTNIDGTAIIDTFANDTNPNTTIIFNTVGNYVITASVYDSEGVLVTNALADVTVEEELPLVTFDQIYTSFDTSLVQTLDLIVKTSDPSIFTKNTNVVSNFDDAYIISCNSLDEARSVYSYYIDKVDAISDMSNVMSIATDENSDDVADLDNLNDTSSDAIAQLSEIVPEVTTTDYSDYIALIDTGANADVNFSVVGNDTSDSNGHGTQMLNYIKSENPNAKVMSIKVFEGNTTSAANVYAGIKLAIESKVKIINLSLVGANTDKNAIVAQGIQEALDAGIIVIGAAGNYNTDSRRFIPGSIDGVIVVGAIQNDIHKQITSNYYADIYVKANSTSEATARYSGMYSANNIDVTTNPNIKTETLEESIQDDKKLYK